LQVFIYSGLYGNWGLWACNPVAKHDALLIFDINWCANGVQCCIWRSTHFTIECFRTDASSAIHHLHKAELVSQQASCFCTR